MILKLKKLKITALCLALFGSLSCVEASTSILQPKRTNSYPNPTDGLAFGFGLGAKLLNLKNIAQKNIGRTTSIRSGDGFANTSTPALSLYMRKHMPYLLPLPTFWGLEFNYLTDLRKKSLHANFTLPGTTVDTGYQYQERFDARAMFGAQLWCWPQLDLWAQAGLQLTNFDYEGITYETVGTAQRFYMSNNFALSPTGGLEIRYSQPCFLNLPKVVTDFIVGWTAGYRNAFKVMGTSSANNTYVIGMSSNWSHTFGLKVLFRF